MAQITWSQDIFSKGELSPLMYTRVTTNAYYNGLKTAKNVITFPQGAAGKRFGTIYLNEISGVTDYNQISFQSFEYLNECVYLLIFTPLSIQIYLEGTLISTVVTPFVASEIRLIDSTTLDNRFRVTTGTSKPKDLRRNDAAAVPNLIIGTFSSNSLTITTPITADLVLPARFTNAGGQLPATTPQIRTGKTYFIFTMTTTIIQIYASATDAKARRNPYLVTNAGTGTNNLLVLNTWTFNDVVFRNLPVYDFTGGYDAITFRPDAETGFSIVVTLSAPFAPLIVPSAGTSVYIGGSFSGNGGMGRIVSVTDSTHFVINIIQSFESTDAIPGSLVFLAEPAWSNSRTWPAKCSSFQSRAIFANTELLPNGVWLSVINDFDNFDGLDNTDDDSAISWFPTSDNVNFIRFIVPYRSLTFHTNTGIYSTPLSFETALTPNNFSLALQESTPATVVQPRAIDNQIVILSGNDVHSMLWDGFNNSYTATIASIANEHLIRDPIDECSYVDLNKAGSRYMFLINSDGTMTIFQTLISESVQGFTPCVLEQSYGNAYFRWAESASDGRAWFVTEREIATQSAPVSITGFTATTLTAVASNFSISEPTLAQFTTGTSLPAPIPNTKALESGVYYWVIGNSADEFTVYLSKEDAQSNSNPFEFINSGTLASVIPWPLTTHFYIEEISFDVYVDCATVYQSSPTSFLSALPRFNGQEVLINGDGFGFSAQGNANIIQIVAHGQSVEVSEAQAGFPINVQIDTMPIAPPGPLGQKGTSLPFANHIRLASAFFVDTVGGTINGTPIQLNTISTTFPGVPPLISTGNMQLSVMKGWNDADFPGISILHTEPFDIKLTGLFYKIEV